MSKLAAPGVAGGAYRNAAPAPLPSSGDPIRMLDPTADTAEPKPDVVDGWGLAIDVSWAPVVPSNRKTPPIAPPMMAVGAPTITLLPMPAIAAPKFELACETGFAMSSSSAPKFDWLVSPSNS